MSSPLDQKKNFFSKIFWNVGEWWINLIFYFPENIQAMLNKHIPMVTRSLTKIMSHLDDLQSIADYLELLGKIHHQSGIQVREMILNTSSFIFLLLYDSSVGYFIFFTNIEKSTYFLMHFLDIFNFYKYFFKIAHFKFFWMHSP